MSKQVRAGLGARGTRARLLSAVAVALAVAATAPLGSRFPCADAALPKNVELLKKDLQSALNELAENHPYALQLGYVGDGWEFSVAAGEVPATADAPARPTTIDDTFLFGSGTKPYTSAALQRLADQGLLNLDALAAQFVDPLLEEALGKGKTLTSMFGAAAAKITVSHLIRMQSGIADFDVPGFDTKVLLEGNKVWTPYDFVVAASKQKPSFVCDPGSCTCYSSTNFELAGLVLLWHQKQGLVPRGAPPSANAWETFDQSTILLSSDSVSKFPTTDPIEDTLTVPGNTSYSRSKLIHAQNASILGWTCGNLVSTTLEVARFFHALLVDETVVSSRAVSRMRDFRPLDVGWARGYIQYGAGLMIEQCSMTGSFPPNTKDWGAYVGHGGDTYGFLSEQGLIPQLNTTFSVIANEDGAGDFVTGSMACRTIELSAKHLAGEAIDLKCGS